MMNVIRYVKKQIDIFAPEISFGQVTPTEINDFTPLGCIESFDLECILCNFREAIT